MGQIRNRKPINMIGYEFQTWRVIAQSDKKRNNNNTYWLCECQICGQQKELCGTEIRLNRTGACKHSPKKINQLPKKRDNTHLIKNEVGNRYGKLVVKKFAYTKNSHAYWFCQCDCGKTTITKGNALRTGSVMSCGCLVSRKEEEIAEILDKYQIKYRRQFTFSDLKDIRLLRFDFAIFNPDDELLGLIEYQGSQHYDTDSAFNHQGKLLLHDNMKKEYCAKNNLQLLELNKTHCLEQELLQWYNQFL